MTLYTEPNGSQFSNVETARLLELKRRYTELIAEPPEPVIFVIHQQRFTDRLSEALREIEAVLATRTGGAR